MFKKSKSAIILVLLLIFSCCACGNEIDDKVSDSQTEVSVQEQVEETKEKKEIDDKIQADDKDVKDQEEKLEEKSETKQEDQEKTETKSKEKKSKSDSKEKKKDKESDKKSDKKDTFTCTISVEGHCQNKTLEVTKNTSVYDALKKSGAKIEAEETMFGIYVVGINGLREGDKGGGSGWTYRVNGELVMDSADDVTVKKGDKISWEFVTGGMVF
ncbi:MAG: DUF4430 domain-containing protein [Clostridia bacterium]|nr:DUF4430 domain-containing protein [Clostridia bacterium]